MIEILLAVIAALYVLGAYQGSTIADVIDESVLKDNQELTKRARFLLTYVWPYTTIKAMMERNEDE